MPDDFQAEPPRLPAEAGLPPKPLASDRFAEVNLRKPEGEAYDWRWVRLLVGLGLLAFLVYAAVPKELQPIVAVANPCYLTAALPEDCEGRIDQAALTDLLALAEGKSVIAAGPGLGRGHGVTTVIEWLVTQVALPLVIDAD